MNGWMQCKNRSFKKNKAGYTATLVARGWAGAVMKLTNWTVRQEQKPTNHP